MKKKTWQVVMIVLMLASAGCGKKEISVNEHQKVEILKDALVTQTPTNQASENEVKEEIEVVTNGNEKLEVSESANAVSSKIVDLKEAPTKRMLKRSVMNEGNLARLAKAMKKSQSKEAVTIAYIGGSITQGSSASTESQYVNQVTKWWNETLGDVKCVNAGVGATDSYLGIHRLDRDVLSQKPDVIFIEFAVNDTNKVFHKYTYDSLLQKCLKADNEPAVILIMMTQEDGTSLEEVHSKLGMYYDLPVLSYRSMIYPEVVAGNIQWSDISPDNIHPNDVGHTILSRMIINYLSSVVEHLDTIDETATKILVKDFSEYAYEYARLVNRKSEDDTKVQDQGSFVEEASFQTFEHGWGTRKGGSITFDVTARNFGVLYKKDTSGTYGKAEIYIDGELFGFVDADFKGGWGNYVEGYQVYSRKVVETHTIEIRLPEDTNFDIISLLIS